MIAEAVVFVSAIGGLTTLAVFAITATRRAGDEKARADSLAVRLEARTADRDELALRLKDEKERADALDAAIAEAAARAVGPVAGSFAELLQAAAAARSSAARPGAPVVRDAGDSSGPPEADRRGPDDLLRPGE